MRFFRRSLTGLFIMALTLGLLALGAQSLRTAFEARSNGGRPAQAPNERVFTANLILAEPAAFTPVLTAFGEIRSRRTLELRAPRAGTVIALGAGVEDGARVTKGQLLLRLDPADATAARDLAATDLSRARAEVDEAGAALLLARDDLAAARSQTTLRQDALTRQRDLAERRVGSASAVETAALAASAADQAVLSRRAALATAQARVSQSQTTLARQTITLAEAERALRETELYAQFDGVLSGITTVTGRILGNNERIGDLIDPDALELAFRVSTVQFARLLDADGALMSAPVTASLEMAGAELVAAGQLSRASAAVAAGQTGRVVYATLTRAPGFQPGDFVTARVTEPALPDVIALPASALGADGTVLALGPDDRLEELPARLLRRQGDSVIVAAKGIAGREVVRERSPLLGAGIKVKPVRPDATQDTPAPPALPALIALTPERRAALIAYVTENDGMPADAKTRILAQLSQDQVPVRVIERLESRMGG